MIKMKINDKKNIVIKLHEKLRTGDKFNIYKHVIIHTYIYIHIQFIFVIHEQRKEHIFFVGVIKTVIYQPLLPSFNYISAVCSIVVFTIKFEHLI